LKDNKIDPCAIAHMVGAKSSGMTIQWNPSSANVLPLTDATDAGFSSTFSPDDQAQQKILPGKQLSLLSGPLYTHTDSFLVFCHLIVMLISV